MIALGLLSLMFLAWTTLSHQESTLAIRPVSQGVSVPDGFSVWHHLDANGIRFKSITPQDDVLLIKFDSRAQSAAAKVVLDHKSKEEVSKLRSKAEQALKESRYRLGETGPANNVLGIGQRILTTLVGIAETRVRLAVVELEEEKANLFQMLLMLGLTMLFAAFGLMSLMVLIIWAIDPQYRLNAMIATTVVLLVAALIGGIWTMRWGKITGYAGTQQYMEAMGVPGFLLPLTILLEFGGGLAVLFGFLTRTTALFTAGFTLLTAFIFHSNFAEGVNSLMFMKNLTIAGGFLLLAITGPGAYSIDRVLNKKW
nr:unnamed protein product [Digitaria exilis]